MLFRSGKGGVAVWFDYGDQNNGGTQRLGKTGSAAHGLNRKGGSVSGNENAFVHFLIDSVGLVLALYYSSARLLDAASERMRRTSAASRSPTAAVTGMAVPKLANSGPRSATALLMAC